MNTKGCSDGEAMDAGRGTGVVMTLPPLTARRPPEYPDWMLRSNRVVLTGLSRLAGLRCIGQEHLPSHGPVLVVANHVAFVDPLLLAVALFPRRSWTVGKTELLRQRWARPWLHRSGMVPVRRAAQDIWAIRTARALLARGECLVLFPEGQVSRSGHLRPGFVGAGFLSLTPGVTVIPAAVSNIRQRGQRLTVHIGPPIEMGDVTAVSRSAANQMATDRIMATLAQMMPLVGGPIQPPPVGAPALFGSHLTPEA